VEGGVTCGPADPVHRRSPESNHAIAIGVQRRSLVLAGLKVFWRSSRHAPDAERLREDMIYKKLTLCGALSMPIDLTFRPIELTESRRRAFEKVRTLSLPPEQAADDIRMLAGHVAGESGSPRDRAGSTAGARPRLAATAAP
jgi:hypothetical protein